MNHFVSRTRILRKAVRQRKQLRKPKRKEIDHILHTEMHLLVIDHIVVNVSMVEKKKELENMAEESSLLSEKNQAKL